MNAFETEDYNGYTITLHTDEHAESPREWSNLGHMLCWHSRYDLGDEQVRPHDDLLEELRTDGACIILPLYLFDHSGISMSTTSDAFRAFDAQAWDWGQVGVIVAYRADILKEYGGSRVSARKRESATRTLIAEVEAYDRYISGEFCGYVITNADGERVDSLWGIDSSDSALREARDYIDYLEAEKTA